MGEVAAELRRALRAARSARASPREQIDRRPRHRLRQGRRPQPGGAAPPARARRRSTGRCWSGPRARASSARCSTCRSGERLHGHRGRGGRLRAGRARTWCACTTCARWSQVARVCDAILRRRRRQDGARSSALPRCAGAEFTWLDVARHPDRRLPHLPAAAVHPRHPRRADGAGRRACWCSLYWVSQLAQPGDGQLAAAHLPALPGLRHHRGVPGRDPEGAGPPRQDAAARRLRLAAHGGGDRRGGAGRHHPGRRSARAPSSSSSARWACAATSRPASRLDALVTYDLLISIFNPGTPLHDGAVIIQGNRVAAAACFLPLTVNPRALARSWAAATARPSASPRTRTPWRWWSPRRRAPSRSCRAAASAATSTAAPLKQALLDALEVERPSDRAPAAPARAAAVPARDEVMP